MQLLIIILFLLLPVSTFAQERGGGGQRGGAPLPPPKNLKLLDPKTDMRFVMQGINEALGGKCTHCKWQGDFAADRNPRKKMPRKMTSMVALSDTRSQSRPGICHTANS